MRDSSSWGHAQLVDRFSQRWLWRMPSSLMWRRVDLVWTYVSEEPQPPDHAGSSLANFSTLKMEAIRSSETSAYTRSTRRHIQEDCILHSHCRENLTASNLTCYLVYKCTPLDSILSQMNPANRTFVRSSLELSSHVRVGPPNVSFLRGFLSKSYIHSSLTHATCRAISFSFAWST
jgi:hypothetical protein